MAHGPSLIHTGKKPLYNAKIPSSRTVLLKQSNDPEYIIPLETKTQLLIRVAIHNFILFITFMTVTSGIRDTVELKYFWFLKISGGESQTVALPLKNVYL